MKRWILALTVLLGFTVSLSYADYVKIMFNVGGTPDQKAANQPGTPPAPGGELGTPGGGGATIGGPGGGGRLPGGLGGPPGGGRLPGGLGGPGRGAGSPDDAGGGAPGLGDIAGGRPGGGPAIGGIGGASGVGDLTGSLNPGAEGLDSRAIWAEGVVEFEGKEGKSYMGGTLYMVKHKYGQTFLPIPIPNPNNKDVRIAKQGPITAFITPDYRLYHIKAPTVAQRLEQKKKDLTKAKNDSNPAALLDLAQWCLQHGQVAEVARTMEKVAKVDPKHPVVIAFQKTDAALKRGVKPGDDGELWRDRLGFKILEASPHYRVVYEEREDLAKRVENRLETNLKAFYYWWALKGHILPVPERRLVAIVVEKLEVVDQLHRELLDAAPLATDGFLARRDNVAIISGTRLDAVYDAFSKFAKPYTLGASPATLLEGKGFGKRDPYEIATAQTLTLLQTALQDEAELMTATHEGTRQLLAAVGILPRAVAAPLWIDSGMGSFFETPKGAFWPGTGAPSWSHLALFKQLEKDKKLDKPEVSLKSVVTDRYFRDARDLAVKERETREKEKASKDQPRPADTDKDKDTADKAMARARAQSWGLTYFLAQQRLPQLQRYYSELQQMPRDLQFDEDVLWQTFLRAFDLQSRTKPTEPDATKVFLLASEWQRYLRNTPLPAAELQRDVAKETEKPPKSGGG